MINTNELMIGNYLIGDNDIRQVKQIEEEYVWLLTPLCKRATKLYARRNWDKICPILLSPAVLEACGFEWNNVFDCRVFTYSKDTVCLYCIDPNEEGIELSASFNYAKRIGGNSNHQLDISTLHQLQNLYFALTQKPLEIDIEKLKKAVR